MKFPPEINELKRFSIINFILLLSIIFPSLLQAQTNFVSKVWVADNGDGTYQNPILHADYSDPDVIRVGDDYYLTASSFNRFDFCERNYGKSSADFFG